MNLTWEFYGGSNYDPETFWWENIEDCLKIRHNFPAIFVHATSISRNFLRIKFL